MQGYRRDSGFRRRSFPDSLRHTSLQLRSSGKAAIQLSWSTRNTGTVSPRGVLSSGCSASRPGQWHQHPRRKRGYLPGVELPVKAEGVDTETTFGDPVGAPGDVPDFRDPPTHRVQRPAFCADLLIRQKVGWFPKGSGRVPPPSGNCRSAGARARSSGTGCRNGQPAPPGGAGRDSPVLDLWRRSGLPSRSVGTCLQRGSVQATGR